MTPTIGERRRARSRLMTIAVAVPLCLTGIAVRSQQAPAQQAPAQQQPAQQAPAQQLPAPTPVPGQTPPIAPNVTETQVPPPVTLPSGPPPPSDVPNRPLTANEAVRIALRYQPNVTVARAAISAAQGRTQQIRAGLLPTVSVAAGYTNVQTLAGSGTTGVGTSGGTVQTGGGSGSGSTSGAGTGTGSTGNGSGGSTGGTTGTGTGSAGTGGTSTGGTSTGGTGTGGTTTGGTTGGGSTGGTTTSVPATASGGGGTLVSPGFQASVSLRQLIFDFNHTRDLVRQASLQERVATDNLARVQSDLVLQVKQAFYLYVQNSQLVTINEQNVANRQSQLALARARLNSGLGLPSDVVTAETALSEAATNLITARANLTLARINLALIMGIDPRTPIDAAPSSENPLATDDVQGLVNTALRQRPEILQATDQLSSTRYGVNAARTTNAPSIAGSIGLLSRGENFPPGNDSFSVGVTLQWNPFDGGLTAGRVKEARSNVETAQADLASAQLSVVSDVSQAYISLRNAEQRVLSTNTEVANAQEGVRIAEGRFGRGLGLFLDIINAQAALVTALSNRANAQFSVDQARAAVSRAIGATLPR